MRESKRHCGNCEHFQNQDWELFNHECKLGNKKPIDGYTEACSDFEERETWGGPKTHYCDDCAHYNAWGIMMQCEKGYDIPKSKCACEEFEETGERVGEVTQEVEQTGERVEEITQEVEIHCEKSQDTRGYPEYDETPSHWRSLSDDTGSNWGSHSLPHWTRNSLCFLQYWPFRTEPATKPWRCLYSIHGYAY